MLSEFWTWYCNFHVTIKKREVYIVLTSKHHLDLLLGENKSARVCGVYSLICVYLHVCGGQIFTWSYFLSHSSTLLIEARSFH